MSNRNTSFVFAYWWVMTLGVTGVMMLLFANRTAHASTAENRMLSGMPALTCDTVLDGSFMTGFESFLSDEFFFRGTVVGASRRIMGVFSTLAPAQEAGAEAEAEVAALIEPVLQEEQPAVSDAAESTAEPAAGDASGAAHAGTADPDGVTEQYFYVDKPDGSREIIYRFPPENIRTVAAALNAYRAALPDDGCVYFAQIPFSHTANAWTRQHVYSGWESTVEDAVASLTSDGVYVLNTPKVLSPHLEAGENVYFQTDHHWTGFGANCLVEEIQQLSGLPSVDYGDYALQVDTSAQMKTSYVGTSVSDVLEVPELLLPARSFLISRLTETREIDAMKDTSLGYMAFLGGTYGPWRQLVTGYHTGRSALVICDSYGNAFTAFLLPYYDQVHMVDYRPAYYSAEAAGASTRTYLERYGIDDIYIILSTASGINSGYMLSYLMQYLDG